MAELRRLHLHVRALLVEVEPHQQLVGLEVLEHARELADARERRVLLVPRLVRDRWKIDQLAPGRVQLFLEH
jgi:hypothetical protein